MGYSKEYLRLIKETVSLSWVVSSWGVVLTLSGGKQGNVYRGLCPFHQEQTGSFHVYEASGRFKCYGCGRRGDVFDFLILLKDWKSPDNLADAVELIASQGLIAVERYGKTYSEKFWNVYPRRPRKRNKKK